MPRSSLGRSSVGVAPLAPGSLQSRDPCHSDRPPLDGGKGAMNDMSRHAMQTLTSFLLLRFPLIPSFHLSRAPRRPRTLALAPSWTPLIRRTSPMGPISRLSHPFHLPVPSIWNLLLPLICFGICFLLCCKLWPVHATLLVTFV